MPTPGLDKLVMVQFPMESWKGTRSDRQQTGHERILSLYMPCFLSFLRESCYSCTTYLHLSSPGRPTSHPIAIGFHHLPMIIQSRCFPCWITSMLGYAALPLYIVCVQKILTTFLSCQYSQRDGYILFR